MRKVIPFIKKQWLTIWIIIALVGLLGLVAYAKYDNSYNMTKKVIAAKTSNTNYFTSNHLKSGGASPTIYQPKEYNQNTSFEIYMFNYDRSSSSAPYSTRINYQLVAELYDEDGNKITTNEAAADILDDDEIILNEYGYQETEVEEGEEPELVEVIKSSYRFGNGQGVSYTINCALIPDDSGYATNHFSLVIPAIAINKASLKLTATPNPQTDYPGLPSISADFSVQTQIELESTEWVGKFDNSETNLSGENNNTLLPKDFDGFNYVITGSGTKSMRLSWDPSVLTPNLQEMASYFGKSRTDILNAANDPTTGYKYVDIICSATGLDLEGHEIYDSGGRYDVQFYIVDQAARNLIDKGDNPSNPTPMSWSSLSTLVTLKKGA